MIRRACGTAVCLFALACVPSGGGGAKRAQTSVLLVTVEGWWSPTATLPNPFAADGLSDGAAFTDAMSVSPQVRPAMASVMTGRGPDVLGVRDNFRTPLPREVPVVAEQLKAAGYATAAFVANPLVGRGSGLDRGFDLFDAPKFKVELVSRSFPPMTDPSQLVHDAVGWIKDLPAGKPYFVWVHLSRTIGWTSIPNGLAPAATADQVHVAVTQLLQGTRRGEGESAPAVVCLGTSGPIDLEQGLSSGYFLTPQLLRVPFVLRSSAGASAPAQAAVWLPDAAAIVLHEAGLAASAGGDAVLPEAAAPTRPRFAWTWLGATEFGWPAEVALRVGDGLRLRVEGGSPDSLSSWGGGAQAEPPPPAALLDARVAAVPRPTKLLPPADLVEQAKAAGWLSGGRQELPPPPDRSARIALFPKITDARRLLMNLAPRAGFDSYREVVKVDPGNLAAFLEPGEFLVGSKMTRRGAAAVDGALRLAPDSPDAWHQAGHLAYDRKDYRAALPAFKIALALRPEDGEVAYDLACVQSLEGDVAAAAESLRRAVRAGFRDTEYIQKDADLRALRADPRFAEVMREIPR